MNAKLVAVTQPTVMDDQGRMMTPEEFIAYTARVSNPSNQHNHSTALRLLEYLITKSHWSPFEMVDITMRIETNRAIMAQILRHKSFSFQEFSQRYSSVDKETLWESPIMRKKHIGGNRQGSSDEVDVDLTNKTAHTQALLMSAYNELIKQGIAPECARMVLPLSTPTTAYMKGPVRSWITYFWQRLDPHAQKEHRDLAKLMFEEFKLVCPNIAELVLRGRPKYEVDPTWLKDS